VYNGEEAIELFKKNEYDLILMDIQMPVMNGVEATINIKSSAKKTPPIIALSANAMEGDTEKYIALGMDDYLSKPLTTVALSKMLSKWFDNKDS
tara:strand:+ start:308 stop:589 length:282 start_codon:yes stop_codon:yes gene_type:complete